MTCDVNEATKKTCLPKIVLDVLPPRGANLIAITSISSHIDLKQVFDVAPQIGRIFHFQGKSSRPHHRDGKFLLDHANPDITSMVIPIQN